MITFLSITNGYTLYESVMVKPSQKQTDKSKKATSEQLDLSLPPPLQLVEKKLAARTPAARKKTDVPTGAVGR